MGYKEITAGRKIAKPTAARFIKAQTGTLGLEIAFSFREKDAQTGAETYERINWVAWMSEKAMERSMKTLVETLGFNGDDSVDANGLLVNPQALAYGKDVELVVEMELNPNDNKSYPRVKWVNEVGGGSAFGSLAPESIKSDLGAIGFKAKFLAAQAAAKAAKPNAANGAAPAAGPVPSHAADGRPLASDGLPF